MQKSPGSCGLLDPEMLRSTGSPAKKVAPPGMPQRTWEKGNNHCAVALYRQRLAGDRLQSSAAAEDSPHVQHHCHPRQLPNLPFSSAPGATPTHCCFLGAPAGFGRGEGLLQGYLAPFTPPEPLFSWCRTYGATVQSFLMQKN